MRAVANMINVQNHKKSTCPQAQPSHGVKPRKRTKLETTPLDGPMQQPQQAMQNQQITDKSTWIFGLINNIEQLLTSFEQTSSPPQIAFSSSDQLQTSVNASSSGFTNQDQSSVSNMTSVSSSTPRNPIARQIKFHEYKGPSQSKRQLTQQVVAEQQQRKPITSVQNLQTSTLCSNLNQRNVDLRTPRGEKSRPALGAQNSSDFSSQPQYGFGQSQHAGSLLSQQNQHPCTSGYEVVKPQTNSENHNLSDLLLLQPNTYQPTSETRCVQVPAVGLEGFHNVGNSLASSGEPTLLVTSTEYKLHGHEHQQQAQSRLQDYQATQISYHKPQNIQPPRLQQFIRTQQPFYSDVVEHMAQDQLVTDYQQNNESDLIDSRDHTAPVMQTSVGQRYRGVKQPYCGSINPAGLTDQLDQEYLDRQETADICDLEPSIGFSPADGSMDELLFSEFIDLQHMPINVDESDWLKKFLLVASN